MPFQLGGTISLDVVQSMKLITGTTIEVYNALANLRMQPTSLVYAANCSIIAGDSAGWHHTLDLIALRSKDGITLGELMLGFPGRRWLKYMQSRDFGPRWLGILATISLISGEGTGGKTLH